MVLMPESSRSSHLASWHAGSEARRRDLSEHVIVDDTFDAAPAVPTKALVAAASGNTHILQPKAIPQ